MHVSMSACFYRQLPLFSNFPHWGFYRGFSLRVFRKCIDEYSAPWSGLCLRLASEHWASREPRNKNTFLNLDGDEGSVQRHLPFYVCCFPSVTADTEIKLAPGGAFWIKHLLILYFNRYIVTCTSEEEYIYDNPHNSSDWDFRISRPLGYKRTFCQKFVSTNKLLFLIFS
jgi:hypothetical protein